MKYLKIDTEKITTEMVADTSRLNWDVCLEKLVRLGDIRDLVPFIERWFDDFVESEVQMAKGSKRLSNYLEFRGITKDFGMNFDVVSWSYTVYPVEHDILKGEKVVGKVEVIDEVEVTKIEIDGIPFESEFFKYFLESMMLRKMNNFINQ